MVEFKQRFVGRQAHINKNGNIQDQNNQQPIFELKKSNNKRVPASPAVQINPQDSESQPVRVKSVNFEVQPGTAELSNSARRVQQLQEETAITPTFLRRNQQILERTAEFGEVRNSVQNQN